MHQHSSSSSCEVNLEDVKRALLAEVARVQLRGDKNIASVDTDIFSAAPSSFQVPSAATCQKADSQPASPPAGCPSKTTSTPVPTVGISTPFDSV